MLTSICPIFPSRDFSVTAGFYEPLGFANVGEYPEEGYLILERDQVELHFFRAEKHKPRKSEHSAFVRVTDANKLWHTYQALKFPVEGIPRVTEADEKPWGICELAIVDPDGNLLRVGHILDS